MKRGEIAPGTALFVNSSLAFASAQLIMAVLHEAGHGLVAQALGFSPKIYAFFEDNPTGNAGQTLAILAGGPIASLVIGTIFWNFYLRQKPRYSFGRLLLLWMAIGGVITFVNYLIVTPFLAAGDTAQFASVLHWGLAARYAAALAGVALVIALARPALRAMVRVAPITFALDTRGARRGFVMRGFYFPVIAGVALTAVAGIGSPPAIVFYESLATFGTIDIVAATLYVGTLPPPGERGSDAPLRVEPLALALYAALVLAYVFAFSHGVPI